MKEYSGINIENMLYEMQFSSDNWNALVSYRYIFRGSSKVNFTNAIAQLANDLEVDALTLFQVLNSEAGWKLGMCWLNDGGNGLKHIFTEQLNQLAKQGA